MPTKLYYITVWNLLSFFAFLAFLWIVNRYASTVPIPFNQIVAASGLFSLFYILLFASTWQLLSKRWVDRLAGVAIAALAIISALRFTYPLIYDWLPRLGVHFQNADAEFEMQEFKARILTAFIFVWAFSAAVVLVYRYAAVMRMLRKATATRDAYRAKVHNLQSRMDAKHFSPHTIENVVTATMGKLTMDNKDEYLDALLVLAEVMHYAIRMQEDDTAVPFEQEWQQVENLVALGRICHGDRSMLLTQLDMVPGVYVPMGVLVMPVENALKYAAITEQTPVQIDYQENQYHWKFTVSNRFREVKRRAIRSNRTGFVLLQQKIDLGGWPIVIDRREQDDNFKVSISGTFIQG